MKVMIVSEKVWKDISDKFAYDFKTYLTGNISSNLKNRLSDSDINEILDVFYRSWSKIKAILEDS